MQIEYAIEGNFGGRGNTELVVMGGAQVNIILMDVNQKQVAVKLSPSQAVLLAEHLILHAKQQI